MSHSSSHPEPAGNPNWRAKKLVGKTFVVVGNFEWGKKSDLTTLIAGEGGEVVDQVSAQLNYLVVGETKSGKPFVAENTAKRLNARGANIVILGEEGIRLMLLPSREEAVAMLCAGEEGCARWRSLTQMCQLYPPVKDVDLSGVDLSGQKLTNVKLGVANLNGANFSHAVLSGVLLDEVRDACFDHAEFLRSDNQLAGVTHCSFRNAKVNCSFSAANSNADGLVAESNAGFHMLDGTSLKNAELSSAHFSHGHLNEADFTSANLDQARFFGVVANDAVFRQANLRQARMTGCRGVNVDFRDADLSGACLNVANLTGADFTNANLTGVTLNKAVLTGANLQGANLTDAILTDADLSNANVADADFTGACLLLTKLDNVDIDAAKGIDTDKLTLLGYLGDNLQELERRSNLKRPPFFDFSVTVATQSGDVSFRITSLRYSPGKIQCSYTLTSGNNEVTLSGPDGSIAECMMALATMFADGKLKPESLTGVDQLKHVKTVYAAWQEAYNLEPSTEVAEKIFEQKATRIQEYREHWRNRLAEGKAGFQDYLEHRQTTEFLRREIQDAFHGLDFSGKDLSGLTLDGFDFRKVNFDGANLRHTEFKNCGLEDATFVGADLQEVQLTTPQLQDTNFRDANFHRAIFRSVWLWNCKLSGANLTNASFANCSFSAADLSQADLNGAKFERVNFDEATTFADGYVIPPELVWSGTTADPRVVLAASKVQPISLNYQEFLARLPDHVQPRKLEQALAMLRKTGFQLYSEVTAKGVIGVIQSDSSLSRVHACELTSAGEFRCGTQKMRPCGTAQGAVCKHLLVLIIGLTKAGVLDAGQVDAWVRRSKLHRPMTFDANALSEIFLRYQGAQASDADWRPTATMPEDFA